MPWYKSGTVSVVLNSNAVTGAGTAFIANSRVGDAFRGPDGRWYEVTNIASDTAMSISPAYQGANANGGSYALAPMQGYVKDSADALRALVNQFGAKLAALGTTGNYDVLPVSKGGTGSYDYREALENLNGQPKAAMLSALSLANFTANQIAYFTSDSKAAVTPLTEFARTLLDDTDRSGARLTLGLGSSAVAAILGQVTQSGGTPTGALMEAGAFPTGRYFRFASGLQVCLYTLTFNGNGSGLRSAAWSFPASFSSPPFIFGNLASYGTVGRYIGCSGGNVPDAYGAPDLSVMITDASAGAITAYIMAVGRWFQ